MGYKQDASGNPIYASPKYVLGRAKFLRTTDGVEGMNVNGGSTSSEIVWNGDGSYWTHEAQGTSETYAAHSGTYGMDTGVRTKGQETRFDYGSNRDLEQLFDSVSFWMQPKAYPIGSNLQIRWRTSGGATPGAKLNVSDYVSNMDLDIWQKVTIPLVDFGLSGTAVAKLVLIYAVKGGQHFYFDDFEMLNSAGDGPYTYRIADDGYDGYNYHISRIRLLVSAGDTGWDSDAFADIVGGLENGIILRHHRLSTSENLWSIVMKDNTDLFGHLTPEQTFAFGNNELMVTFTLDPGIASVVVTDDDVLDVIIRDNLTALSDMRAYAHYGIEETT